MFYIRKHVLFFFFYFSLIFRLYVQVTEEKPIPETVNEGFISDASDDEGTV